MAALQSVFSYAGCSYTGFPTISQYGQVLGIIALFTVLYKAFYIALFIALYMVLYIVLFIVLFPHFH